MQPLIGLNVHTLELEQHILLRVSLPIPEDSLALHEDLPDSLAHSSESKAQGIERRLCALLPYCLSHLPCQKA